MRSNRLAAIALGIGLAAGCGGSSPTGPSPSSTALSEGAVRAIVGQAVSQAAILAPGSDVSFPVAVPCPEGGSIRGTYAGTLPPNPSATIVSTSKTEFNDCNSQGVVMRGDPYLLTTGEHTFGSIVGGMVNTATGTITWEQPIGTPPRNVDCGSSR